MSKEKCHPGPNVAWTDAVFTGFILAFVAGMTLFSCIVIVCVVF